MSLCSMWITWWVQIDTRSRRMIGNLLLFGKESGARSSRLSPGATPSFALAPSLRVVYRQTPHAHDALLFSSSLVLKNIDAGPLKTIIFAAFSLNLTLTYIIMLVPPREYLEEIVVRSNRYDWGGRGRLGGRE